jgi:hypothetical protein
VTFVQQQTNLEQSEIKATIMFDETGLSYLPWRNAEFVFEQAMPFFNSPTYSHRILTGLVTSSGGLTESTLKASQKSIFTYLSQMKGDTEQLSKFINLIIDVFQANLKDDRVTIPLMKTVEMLLSTDYLNDVKLARDFCNLHTLCV